MGVWYGVSEFIVAVVEVYFIDGEIEYGMVIGEVV